MTMAKCTKCGTSGLHVTITATCGKCGAAFPLCNTCKLAWNIKNCPSCGAKPIQASWRYLDRSGSGSVTDDMLSYLDTVGLSPKTYVKEWNAAKEKRLAEREKDGDAAHRGIALPPVEVEFLRKMEDFMFEPIFTVADDRSSYAVIEDGNVVKLRFYNADIRDNMPDSISKFEKLREFRFERSRNGKGGLQKLPDTFVELPSLETLVLKAAAAKVPETSPPALKKLAIPGKDKIDPVFGYTGLEELSLAGCWTKMEKLEDLGNLVNLKKLKLSYLQISQGTFNKLPESLKKLEKLEELDLRGMRIAQVASDAWPAWLAELPSLKIVHRDHDTIHGWGPIETALHERFPEGHLGNILTPEMTNRMNLSDMENWWNDNNSEILKIGWSGVDSRA